MDVRDGTHDSPKYVIEGYPLVTSKNLVSGQIDFSTCNLISKEDHDAISKRSAVDDGDILYAMIGTIGNPVIVEKSCDFSIKNVALFKFNNEKVFNRYIYHFLNSPLAERQFNSNSRGGTQKFVSLSNIRDLQIPLPPLAEQKRIAAILDKADSLRRKRQQAIQLADQFLRAVFLDMFGDPVTNPKGWQISTFGEIFDVRDGTHDSPKYLHTGYPLITSKNIKNGMLDLRDVNYISQADYDSINKRSKVDVGDVLMPMIGTIGNPVIVNFEPNFAIKNVALIKTNNSKIPPEIVKMLLDGPLLKHAITSLGRGGTQKFLSLGDIRQLKCFIPDTEVIDKFLLINNKTQKLVGKYLVHNKSNIFESLSQKAFAGEL
ncbi:restriction endonuclease subunit S [Methylobacter marinus]|jgi:type I restriction enzyme, S subunit|uniref:restriction endonuclease subunit S n=1 Tax=Methylobacter marinus TaxID=34058 RepID=UPI0003A212B7|nr:restriction endonuclease subunit S [Methylobacter marinus]